MMINKQTGWKVAAGATAAAIGVTGMVWAGSGGGSDDLREAIRLRDGLPVAEASARDERSSHVKVVPARIISYDANGEARLATADVFASPWQQAPPAAGATNDDSPDSPNPTPGTTPRGTAQADDSPDSPNPTPGTTPRGTPQADDSPDSPDPTPRATPQGTAQADDSPDSPSPTAQADDSPDSHSPTAQADDSPDSPDEGSSDSAD